MKKILYVLAILVVMFNCNSQSNANINVPVTVTFGTLYGSNIANTYVTIYNNDDTTLVARQLISSVTTYVTAGSEDLDGSGNATGSYHILLSLPDNFNGTVKYPLRVRFDESNYTGVVATTTVVTPVATIAIDSGVTAPSGYLSNYTALTNFLAASPIGWMSADSTTLNAITSNILSTTVPGAFGAGTVGYKVGGSQQTGSAVTLPATSPTGFLDSTSISAIGSNLLSQQIESTVNLKQALEIISAYCAGNVNTTAKQYSALGSPSTVRITYGLDSAGNRTITITP